MYIKPIEESWFVEEEELYGRKHSGLKRVHSHLFGPRIPEEEKLKRQYNAYFAVKGRVKCKINLDDVVMYCRVSNNLKILNEMENQGV